MTLKEKLEGIEKLAQFLFRELEEVELEANKQEKAILEAYGVTSKAFIDDSEIYRSAEALAEIAYRAEAAKDETKDLFPPINRAIKEAAKL